MKHPAMHLLPAAALTLLAAAGALAGDGPPPERRVDAVILMGGQDAGRYREETARSDGEIRDTVEQDLVINRLGSAIELRSLDLDVEDPQGRLTGGHFEASSSKSTVTTDLVVKDHTLQLTVVSGGKSYPRTLPFTGELLGPAGMRALLAQAKPGQPLRFQTFASALGAVAEITLTPAEHETLNIDGQPVDALKAEYRIAGYPLVTTLWLDRQGYTVRGLQESPLGPIEIRRGRAAPLASQGATLPAESYQQTVAVSDIRLPHPRQLQQVTLEIRAKDAAGIQWPDLASSTQRVISRTPQSVVLEVSRPLPGPGRDAAVSVQEADLAPTALLQSDDEGVQKIAFGIAAGERDPWKLALALQRWVNENMRFDAGIAIAPAAEVARDRHGTCVGYAVLLASLARARTIPARLVMGYVYESRIWGGHAWVEMLINGQWRPLDAAEYAPAVADAARFAVIRDAGQSGTIAGMGELAKLFSKVDIRILSYRLGDRTVQVPRDAAGYTLEGSRYVNPWLGLTVVKPQDAAFTGLDAHWPDAPSVLTVKQGAATVQVWYAPTDAATSPNDLVAKMLGDAQAPLEPLQWHRLKAARGRAGDQEALAALDGDVTWAVLATGPDSHALLAKLLPGISIAPL